MTRRILFIDFDGTLTSEKHTEECVAAGKERNESGMDWADPQCARCLEEILSTTGCELVLCSTWRVLGLEQMNEEWKRQGLPGRLADATPTDFPKWKSIREWLRRNPDVNYVVLDDQKGGGFERQVFPSSDKGVTSREVVEMFKSFES